MIIEEINKLYKTHNTYNPIEICNKKDISIIFVDLNFEAYGLTVCNNRHKTIVINNNIPEKLQEFTIAHELGHCILHTELSTPFMRKTCSPTVINKLESEAHRFAFVLLSKNYPEMKNLTKYQVIDLFNLPNFMERFMLKKDYERL